MRELRYYKYRGLCLCPLDGQLPAGAEPAEPFGTPVYLIHRDPMTSSAISLGPSEGDVLSRLDAGRPMTAPTEEGALGGRPMTAPTGSVACCPLPVASSGRPMTAPTEEGALGGRPVTAPTGSVACCPLPVASSERPMTAPTGGIYVNTAFPKALDRLPGLLRPKLSGLKLTLVGLGDVGGTLLTALKLLGAPLIDEIAIYDPNEALCRRYELELNQVLDTPLPRITLADPARLFDCDAFLFTASRGVPPVGASGDMRMVQFEKNRDMLKAYSRQAREADFAGLFCQISDPVDLLARSVFLQTNRDENGVYDFRGQLPEQIVGFGLGVMKARADDMARRLGADCPQLAAYGPHGAGLVVANHPTDYDPALSAELTARTVGANMEVRGLGFKPYIAPALSSACLSILRLLRGEAFYGAVPMDGVWFGCRSRRELGCFRPIPQKLHPELAARIQAAWQALRQEEATCAG